MTLSLKPLRIERGRFINEVADSELVEGVKMASLAYEKITKDNLGEAVSVQNTIFPHENGKQNFIDSINGADYRRELIFWLVYLDKTPIGVTGLYAYNEYPHDAWMGWFGVLPKYRGKGYGGQIFDFFEREARQRGYENIRLYTDSLENSDAVGFYEKKGMVSEEYSNPEDIFHATGKILIFSKSLNNSPVEKWDNKFLNLSGQENRQNKSD